MEITFELPALDFRDPKVLLGVALLAFALIHAGWAWWRWGRVKATIETRFSPNGGCTAAILAELQAARSEILVQAYSFSCPDIAQALIAAATRRVKVVVLLDRSNEAESYSAMGELTGRGLEVWIDACHAIAHNKVMVIDRRTVITGSFNFTRQAEKENAENLLILRDHPELAAIYRTNLLSHRDHCQRPGQRGPHAAATSSSFARRAG